MIKEKVTDYIFHTTFDSSITDITDKIFTANPNWQILYNLKSDAITSEDKRDVATWVPHTWANNDGETREDAIKCTYQTQ